MSSNSILCGIGLLTLFNTLSNIYHGFSGRKEEPCRSEHLILTKGFYCFNKDNFVNINTEDNFCRALEKVLTCISTSIYKETKVNCTEEDINIMLPTISDLIDKSGLTYNPARDCVLKKKLKGVTAASEMSSEDHLISKSNENSLQSSNNKLNSVSPISSSNQPNDGSPDISQSQTDDGSVQSSLSQSFGSSQKSKHSAINDRPLESSSTGTKKESSEYSHIAVESSSMDSSNGVSNAGSLESSSSKANTGSIKTSQNPNPVAKGSHISLYQDDDYESIGSILDKLNTTFLYICSKLMPNEALKQNVRIHWNKIILVFLTVIFCAEAYTWFRFIVYLWKAMAKFLQRIYYIIRHSVLRHKVKPKTNGNMNIVVPTNIFKGKLSVPRVSTVVITFGNGVASKHLEIAESVIGKENERKYPIKSLTIKKEKDLDNLPRSKVALIFVDFTESNKILEDPDEKKNIKFLTVKNILDTKEMKAIIIYCYDVASEKLDFGQLYAPKLISITTHPLLKKLEKDECVLSINKELSEYQMAHLKQKLEKFLPT